MWCVFFFQIHFRPFRVYFFFNQLLLKLNRWHCMHLLHSNIQHEKRTRHYFFPSFPLLLHKCATHSLKWNRKYWMLMAFFGEMEMNLCFGYMWAFVYRSTVVWTIFVIAFTAFNWKWLHSPRSFRAKKESVIKFVGNGEILSNLINFSPRLWTVCLREHFYISIHYVSISFNFDEEQNK